jgi:DNA-directed RNA polymerase specialized sigma24 family protein
MLAAPPDLKERAMHLPMTQPADSDPDLVPPQFPAPPDSEPGSDPTPPPDAAGPFASAEERRLMLRDRALEKLLAYAIRALVPSSEIEDVIQDTLHAAHDAPKLPAGDGKERNNYVIGIGKNKAVDHRRRALRFPELDEQEGGLDHLQHVAQATHADAAADRDFLDKITRDVGDDQAALTLRCLARQAMGEDLAEIAREVGIPYDTLYKRVTTMQRRVKERGKQLGGFMALLIALGVSWGSRAPKPERAADEPQMVELLEPATSTHVGETDPMDWARVLRGEAFRACMNDQWEECNDGLNVAGQFDPDGEQRPEVKAARADVLGGIGARLKPGSTWAPPRVRVYAPWAAR